MAERSLYLFRDRLGEKPLYYSWDNRRFAFASDIRALKSAGFTASGIDRGGVAALCQFGYIPAPHSVYRDVFKLPPGNILKLGTDNLLGNDRVAPRPYWDSFAMCQDAVSKRLDNQSDADVVDSLEEL